MHTICCDNLIFFGGSLDGVYTTVDIVTRTLICTHSRERTDGLFCLSGLRDSQQRTRIQCDGGRQLVELRRGQRAAIVVG